MRGPLRALTEWCWGSALYECTGNTARAINALMLASIEYTPIALPKGTPPEAPTIRFTVRYKDADRTERLFGQYDIPFRRLGLRGLPTLLRRYRTRPGLFLGALLFIGILLLLGSFVWDVRVVSADGIPEEQLLAMLEEDGVRPGAYLPQLDLHEICRQFPARHPEVGWLSVNMMGTVAEIEVRAYDPGGEKPAPARSVKALVASCNGVIERLEIYGGSAVCAVGQPVFKGELLVNCVVEHPRGTSLEDACGFVYARVSEQFTVEQPFTVEETLPTDPIPAGKSLFLFGKTINFPNRGSNLEGKYAIIEKTYRPLLCGQRLPVTVTERLAVGERQETRTLSREEALARAEQALAEEIETRLADCELLGSETEITESDGAIRLTRKVEVVKNIAIPIEIGFAE